MALRGKISLVGFAALRGKISLVGFAALRGKISSLKLLAGLLLFNS